VSAPLPLFVARLRGDQVTMGRQHAELLRGAGGYEGVIDYYPRMPEVVLGGPREGHRPPALTRVLKPLVEASLRSLEARRPAELRARSRAFFAGLGVPADFSRYVSVMDVMQNVIGLAGGLGIGPTRALCARAIPACSSLAVWDRASADGTLRHARNFDFPGNGIWDVAPALVFCSPPTGLRYGFATTRGGDVACVSAFNEAGLTLTAHTRFHRDGKLFGGLAVVDLCHQIVRYARSLDEAVQVAKRRPPASTWGLTVTSGRERSGLVIELTSKGLAAIQPLPKEDFLAHTNRYADPSLARRQVAPATGFLQNSDGRLRNARAWGLRAQEGQPLDALDLQRFLHSCDDPDQPGACRGNGGTIAQGNTVHSVVLEPESESVWVSVGLTPTGGGPWVQVPWNWGSAVECEELETPADAPRYQTPPAQAAYAEAVRFESQGGQWSEVEGAVLRALGHAPQDPGLCLLAGGHALRRGQFQAAFEHFEQGLRFESAGFPRAQLLLWASRAAHAAEEPGRARELRAELLGLEGNFIDDFKAEAKREALRPVSRGRFKRVDPIATFPDLIFM
jgi:hypothetical protein